MTPLHDIRVLDLTDESGAFAGRILADLGADVVMIEPPEGVGSVVACRASAMTFL